MFVEEEEAVLDGRHLQPESIILPIFLLTITIGIIQGNEPLPIINRRHLSITLITGQRVGSDRRVIIDQGLLVDIRLRPQSMRV